MRNRFEEQLLLLNNMLTELGGLVEAAIEMAAKALENRDIDLARQVMENEEDIDRLEKEIEDLCMRLLLQQQPVARDLRLISAALKMITDMERIGDQAADIAEIIAMMGGAPYVTEIVHIAQMAKAAIKMVTQSIDAFVRKDLAIAQDVIARDDEVDDLFDATKYQLIEFIRGDGDNKEQAIDLLMIAKYFERIGDHAVNIAEWVVYSITGESKK
ncbi:MAG: phosphate signaling complex protein PhoU [Defluviitaleaceae bacterium]|nr:phosphate signaling complex protein PhoU [Defluviitaleaceae bacterium]